MPLIDDGLFASDDFLAAIGQEVPTRNKTSEYATIGLSKTRISKSGKMAPVKPNYDGMSPGTKSVAMKAHSKELKGFRDLLLRERRKDCGGRAINWDRIQYTGDNHLTCVQWIWFSYGVSRGEIISSTSMLFSSVLQRRPIYAVLKLAGQYQIIPGWS